MGWGLRFTWGLPVFPLRGLKLKSSFSRGSPVLYLFNFFSLALCFYFWRLVGLSFSPVSLFLSLSGGGDGSIPIGGVLSRLTRYSRVWGPHGFACALCPYFHSAVSLGFLLQTALLPLSAF